MSQPVHPSAHKRRAIDACALKFQNFRQISEFPEGILRIAQLHAVQHKHGVGTKGVQAMESPEGTSYAYVGCGTTQGVAGSHKDGYNF